jgi:hypothetical protein
MFDNSGYAAFANSLSNAGAAFGNALADRQKQQYLSDLVPLAQSGKYGELGAALMSIDPKTGLAFMEKQRQQDEFNKLYPQPPEMSISPAQTGHPPRRPANEPSRRISEQRHHWSGERRQSEHRRERQWRDGHWPDYAGDVPKIRQAGRRHQQPER